MALKRVDTLVRRVQRRLGDLGQANVEKSDILDALTQTQFNIARDALAIKTTGTLNLTAGITSVSVSPSIYKLKILTPPSNWCVPLKHISDVDRWNEIISSPWTITDEFPYYVFTVTGLSTAPSVGSVWTNNTANFVVQSTNLSGSAPNITGTITCTGTNSPTSTGALTKVSGAGDATMNFTGWQQSAAQPYYFFVFGSSVSFWPTPSANAVLNILYYGYPATGTLALGNDPTLGQQWDDCMVLGACDQLQGGDWNALYGKELLKVQSQNINETTMPLVVSSFIDDVGF